MAKNLVRRLVRGPDGQMRLIFVDPVTGTPVANPQGYNIVNPGNTQDLSELGLNPFKTDPPKGTEAPKSVSQTVINDQITNKNNDAGGAEGGSGFSRDPTNNYGYVDQPGFMGLTNYAPGMIGMVSKGINAGINANNMGAVNAARGVMGLEDLGPMDTAKGFFGFDKGLEKGHVADVSIGKNEYSIGLEAMDDLGRTTLTPEEAKSRSVSLGPIKEIDDPEVGKSAHTSGGVFSGISNAVSSFMDSIFGPDEDDVKDDPLGPTYSYDPAVGAATQSFPDAPSAPSQAAPGSVGVNYSAGVEMAGNDGFGGGADYSGLGGQDSPSESGPGPGMGLGGSSTDNDDGDD